MSNPPSNLFGAQPSTGGGGGFTFGAVGTTPAASGGFSFGAAPTTTAGASTTTTAGAGTGGFTFGGPGFKAGAPSTAGGMSGGFSFGTQPSATPAAAPTASTGFGLAAAAKPTGGLGLFSQPVAAVAPNTTAAAAPAGGFGLGSFSKPAGPGQGFSFGGGAAAPATTGVSFGGTPGGTTATSSLGFGGTLAQAPLSLGTQAMPAATTGGLTLGSLAAKPTGFGTPVAAVPAATTGNLTLGSLGAKPTGFGTPVAAATSSSAPAAAAAGVGFGAKPAMTAPLGLGGGASLGFGTTPTTAVAATAGQGISFGAKPVTSATPLGTGTAVKSLGFATATSAGGGLSLGAAAKPPDSLSTLLGKPTTTAATSAQAAGLSLNIPSATSTAATTKSTTGLTLGNAGGFGAVAAAAKPAPTTGATAAAAPAQTTHSPTMSYHQLEQNINKWTVQLEGQEKIFLNQATQVNAWDRMLMENGETITVLHSDLEKVKTDQQRLEHELDFIMAQQRELEDMLVPLEEGVRNQQQGLVYSQHADSERERTYQLAENIDGQLKRMVQDLREIIEHLNTANAPQDTSDPITQIGKILNAHMDSLQWIDQNTVMLQRKVDEVTKQSEIVRRDQEKNVHLAFD